MKYIVAINGSFYPVDGTSASCPVVAGMISLVNSARIKSGKPTLGWINPTLYTNANHFINDITYGENKCLRIPDKCCTEGFRAVPGWDPVTGWGSIDYGKFENFFLGLKIEPIHTKRNKFDVGEIRYDRGYLVLFFVAVIVLFVFMLYCLFSFAKKIYFSPVFEASNSRAYGSIEDTVQDTL